MHCDDETTENKNCSSYNIYSIYCRISLKSESNETQITLKNYQKVVMSKGESISVNLNHSFNLKVLKIIENKFLLRKLNDLSQNSPNLFHLSIINSNMEDTMIGKLKMLQFLDLSFNPISNFSIIEKLTCFQLKILNLSNTKIEKIIENNLKNCSKLIHLKINNCPIYSIKENSFKNLKLLKIIEFIKISFVKFSVKDAKNLKNIEIAKGYNFFFCCLLKNFRGKSVECSPVESVIETCSNLIDSIFTKFICWAYGILGIILNFCSFYFFLNAKLSSKYYRLTLTFADFLTATYLLSLVIINEFYGDSYLYEKLNWKNSVLCQFLGSKLTFSALLSSSSTLLIAIETFISIRYSLKNNIFLKYSLIFSISTVLIILLMVLSQFLHQKVILN